VPRWESPLGKAARQARERQIQIMQKWAGGGSATPRREPLVAPSYSLYPKPIDRLKLQLRVPSLMT
jgi:hypothetical protein